MTEEEYKAEYAAFKANGARVHISAPHDGQKENITNAEMNKTVEKNFPLLRRAARIESFDDIAKMAIGRVKN